MNQKKALLKIWKINLNIKLYMTRIAVKQNKNKNLLNHYLTSVSFASLCFVFLIFVNTRKSNKNSSSWGTSQNKQNTDLF